jgi:hypothetical protein
MPRLRRYDLYIDKLMAYAEACQITVVYRIEPSDGVYIPARRKIVLDKDLEPGEEIATFLHELGHAMDDSLENGTTHFKKLQNAYHATYEKKPTKYQRSLVVACEKRAWEYGRGIARKLRIPLGKWFTEAMEDGLKSYRETETQNR